MIPEFILLCGYIRHRKGSHYFIYPTFNIFGGALFEYRIMFTEKSKYKLNGVSQRDGNKLFGLTFNNSLNHHKNSARFIWRYLDNDRFQIGIRSYTNGKASNEYFDKIFTTNEEIKLSMSKGFRKGIVLEILIDGKVQRRLFGSKSNFICIKLYPFFGGENKAPSNIEYRYMNNK